MWNSESKMTSAVNVACLYNVADLQRLYEKEKLTVTRETNRYLLFHTVRKLGPACTQKLIKKLVDRGEIEWDGGEDFEVESILDHMKDEKGVDFYHIKWRGWSNEHNTWEPRENLQCDSLVEEYHAVNKEEGIDKNIIRKRKYFKEDPFEAKQQKVRDLMERILSKSKDMTPLTLLKVSDGLSSKVKSNNLHRLRGLTHNGPGYKSRVTRVKPVASKLCSKRSKAYKQLRAETQVALKKWEVTINKLNNDPAPILVLNEVDIEGPPDKFQYISDYKVGDGIEIPNDPLVGCECGDCYANKKQCCSSNAGADFAYYKHKRVRVPPGHPIYECNKRCQCGPDCPNRVVQYGRKFKVAIFRTNNNRGWGVKAMQKIKRGSFVMEYIGEVISNKEAERRGKVYDAEGMTYLFDLDYNDSDEPFCVDAGFYGNISHFVNHCCDPNMAVYGVWINHLDPRLPRIALFAKRDIKAGEELTFDYMMTGDTTHQLQTAQRLEAETGIPSNISTSKEGAFDTQSESGISVGGSESGVSSYAGSTTSKSAVLDVADDDLMGPPPALMAVTPSKEDGARLKLPVTPLQLDSDPCFSDKASDITPSERSSHLTTSEASGSELNMDCGAEADQRFFRRSIVSPSPAMRYRIRCQCGAANCRQFLY